MLFDEFALYLRQETIEKNDTYEALNFDVWVGIPNGYSLRVIVLCS